jgi:hypothetical protein
MGLYDMSDAAKIGVALTSFGLFFMFLGVIFLLDSALLTLGNLLFVAGVVLVMGPQRCRTFFLDPARRRASVCFVVGVFLVMMRWCFFGLIIQGFGALNLFGNFVPVVVMMLEATPVLRPIFAHPQVQKLLETAGLRQKSRSV